MTGWTVSCRCELSTTKDTWGFQWIPVSSAHRHNSPPSLCSLPGKCWCEMLPNSHTLVAMCRCSCGQCWSDKWQVLYKCPGEWTLTRVIIHWHWSSASYTFQSESSLSWQYSFSSSWMTLRELAPEMEDLVLPGFGKSWHSHHRWPFHLLN